MRRYFAILRFAILKICFIFNYVDIHVSLCMNVRVSAGASGCQRNKNPLELKLYVVLSCPLWVLETQPVSSARAVNVHKL